MSDPIQLTFDTDTDTLARTVEAYTALFFYQPTIDGEPNPISPTDFFKQQCIDWVKGNVTNYELSKAAQQAVETAQENMDEIVIT